MTDRHCQTGLFLRDLRVERPLPGGTVEATRDRLDGVGTLKRQSVLTAGRFVFLYGLADGSAPMTGEAGTYQIARDTATHTITYSTDSSRIGLVFMWTPESTSGDTMSYVVMSAGGEVTARGRSVRRRQAPDGV